MDSGLYTLVTVLLVTLAIAGTVVAIPTFSANATTTDVLNYWYENNPSLADRPGQAQGRPDEITMNFNILGIRQISETGNEVVYDMYFRYVWFDHRLQYEGGPERLVLSKGSGAENIWIPDVFFSNAHDVKDADMSDPHSTMKIYRDGRIWVSSKVTLTAYCLMDLHHFPRDVQECGFNVESYKYTRESVPLKVSKEHTYVSDIVIHPKGVRNFQISNLVYSKATETFGPGITFDKVQVRLTFTRVSSHYIALVYVPCVLLVVLSALVFWFPTTALLERVLYGSVLLLAVVPIMVGSQLASPAVGYLKAMDVWVVAHFFFLAVAVLEVLLIHLMLGKSLRLRMGRRSQADQMELVSGTDNQQQFIPVKFGLCQISPAVAGKIDLGLRIIYPAAYVVFNAVFWAAY